MSPDPRPGRGSSPSDDDTQPGLDPDSTLSQFYLCRFTRWGCRYGVRYWPGGRDEAHSVIRLHEWQCQHRFGPDPH